MVHGNFEVKATSKDDECVVSTVLLLCVASMHSMN